MDQDYHAGRNRFNFPALIRQKEKILLASKSPRRKQLMEMTGLAFEQKTYPFDESRPESIPADEVAAFLAKQKSDQVGELPPETTLITCDTIVVLDGRVIEKPADARDAVRMLESLSGNMHLVYSGFCLRNANGCRIQTVTTEVFFRTLEREEIEYYVEEFKPFDKAGAYGVQEWMGLIGVEYIRGSHFNVMGLPVSQLYSELKKLWYE